jgi:hypothetical protein
VAQPIIICQNGYITFFCEERSPKIWATYFVTSKLSNYPREENPAHPVTLISERLHSEPSISWTAARGFELKDGKRRVVATAIDAIKRLGPYSDTCTNLRHTEK